MIWLHTNKKGSDRVGQGGSVVGGERGVEGVRRWVEGKGMANGVMMGASASAGEGGAAIYTDLVADVERAGRGYGVTRVERVVQGCSKAFPNSDRLADPRTLPRSCSRCVSNILF